MQMPRQADKLQLQAHSHRYLAPLSSGASQRLRVRPTVKLRCNSGQHRALHMGHLCENRHFQSASSFGTTSFQLYVLINDKCFNMIC